ncbi:hypothetical protein F0231_12490 [Vibrio sp. RE86]|uniref:hypothetical protein n=1 Tax=Vibrio sp. RE86 TaxID=2607605 RepID=UPI001493C3BE|nr:hypothetical protein [Vibrio sp. RE86]NOH80560.1 hypothetical protein [Vibrio sp. RE86]
MEKQRYRHEYRLMFVAIICAALVVFGHLILAKGFAELVWTEYTAAAIPFVMFGLCLYAIRYAAKTNSVD